MSSLDFSLPISALLRAGTAVAHQQLESSPGAALLAQAQIHRDEYIRFLVMLWLLYSKLEEHLATHALDPVLTSACNPQLHRVHALSSDLSQLTQLTDWRASPLAAKVLEDPPSALKAYMDRLDAVALSEPPLLLAHAYVRYLGDMSGGQFMKRRFKKAYNLKDEALQFFQFGSNGNAGLADIKTLKEWFRDGMNNHVVDAGLKERLVAEANIAFQLNEGLLSELKPSSAAEFSEVQDTQIHRVESTRDGFAIILVLSLGLLLVALMNKHGGGAQSPLVA